MNLKATRAIVDAIHSGALKNAPTTKGAVFGLDIITKCPNVPDEVLVPRNAWADPQAFDSAARALAQLFMSNFEKYASIAGPEVVAAGPRINEPRP